MMHGLQEQESGSATSTGKGRTSDRVVVGVHTGWTDGERFCFCLRDRDLGLFAYRGNGRPHARAGSLYRLA